MYNVAATMSQLGAVQTLTNAEGLKTSSDYFQRCAGVLQHIRDALSVRISQRSKCEDFSESCLTALINLMLAQAQECFWERSNLGEDCRRSLKCMRSCLSYRPVEQLDDLSDGNSDGGSLRGRQRALRRNSVQEQDTKGTCVKKFRKPTPD